MQLESINVGQVEIIEHNGKSFSTGICKQPSSAATYVDTSGVRGDAIVDTEHHGGEDQAVYAYSADDYDWWASEQDIVVTPGLFGENLTIRGLPSDMAIGDRLLIGEVVLEATGPRIPCSTFAARMEDTGFGLAFRAAARPGIYFRVLNAGEINPGDAVTHVADGSGEVSVLDLFRFCYALQHDAETLERFLEVPLASRFRSKVESKLAALQSGSG